MGVNMRAKDIEEWIVRIPESGCWIWMGYVGKNDGYGRSDNTVAHRKVYSLLVGEIPQGKQLDHLCRVRCCVNPNHLEPVTAQENVLRGTAPQALNAKKTHCPYGHDYVYDNKAKRRNCVICRAIARKKYKEKINHGK